MTTLKEVLLDAKKAVATAVTLESAAVGFGLLDSAEAGYVSAALGALTTAIVYLTENVPKGSPKPKPGKHEAAA